MSFGGADGGRKDDEAEHMGKSIPLRSLSQTLFALRPDDLEKLGTDASRVDDLLSYCKFVSSGVIQTT